MFRPNYLIDIWGVICRQYRDTLCPIQTLLESGESGYLAFPLPLCTLSHGWHCRLIEYIPSRIY